MQSDVHVPLFPLKMVLFPGEETALHIFEPRYQAMLKRCLSEKMPFCLVHADADGGIAGVATMAHVVEVVEAFKDGRSNIRIRGGLRVQIKEQIPGAPSYDQARVFPLLDRHAHVDNAILDRVISLHMKLLEVVGHEVRPAIYEKRESLLRFLVHNAGLTTADKQRVLECAHDLDRYRWLQGHMEMLIPKLQKEQAFTQRVRQNGYFRDYNNPTSGES